ncbi:UDP-N-acetylmuramoyl-tripeptide--D-alanyl-D-alanine ligase [Pelagibacterium montanilacus]|uniref:UDP-N-acetylmuramoyl-tripeptide--D-alanyl-D- alanine ligase n=1 Tax=Pelagibacterium montanilacus TaxID=2185280 RepID=UPI000F8D4488|nr:UDP-N-acetylmuramoyl-tripeptide--D-alanyl-D-alanine ligase [Pelagibacterium montanilacus]
MSADSLSAAGPGPALYALDEIVTATGGQARNCAAGPVSAVTIDSREVPADALFVAIRGDRFDGHDFVAQAIAAGAKAALVSQSRADELSGNLPLIVVPDALAGLEVLARHARARADATCVGVTGSVGKTSTKEALRTVLAQHGPTHASIRSFNNHWGVPLMVARMPAGTRFGVFEMGMSAPGEIAPLSRIARPHVAIITAIAPVHLEFFDSVAGIADAKAEIFDGLEPGGLAVLNIDHDYAERLTDAARAVGARVLTYGFAEGADVRIRDHAAQASGNTARLSGDGLDLAISLAAPGRHAVSNGVAALLAARELGIAADDAARTLAGIAPPEGRGAAHRLGPEPRPLVLVDESYNANPASMRAALSVFSHHARGDGRKVLVLADMLELGPQANSMHRDLADAVLAAGPDAVYLVGPHMRALAEALPASIVAGWTHSAHEIAGQVLAALAYGDTVMVKGSNGLKLGALVARIREQF